MRIPPSQQLGLRSNDRPGVSSIVDSVVKTASETGTGHALPAACYLDPGFFELERERVLLPGWHAVARVHDLPEPGDYRAVDLFGEPLLLVRGTDRKLRALSRICRHRAFPIATGDGNAKRIACPYHRWSYELDGRLAAAPLMDDVPGFDRAACRLPEYPLAEWQGFVLASADRKAEPIVPKLGPLDALLDSIGFRDFVETTVLDFDSAFNWKVLVDNFMESYHHQGPHVNTLQKTNPAAGTHAMDLEGPFAALENPAIGAEPPFWVFQVFPATLLAATRGATPTGTWYEMQINSHDRFQLRIHLLAPPALADNTEFVRAFTDLLTEIHLEDIPACEGIQQGLECRDWEPGPLSFQEEALRHFQRWLAGRITG
jgi:phenylpropionate dioxygenase-like ring-hydroxylating dioxygenase large terminal subunit